MGRNELVKTAVSVVVIIMLAVIIVNINKLVSPRVQMVGEGQNVLSGGSAVNYGECFNKDPSTVVFVHSNSCPHCRDMMPIIEELESEGYRFYWAESSDSEAREIVDNCFSDLLSGYVPQFICPATGKQQTGSMGKAELKEFVDSCV